MNTQIQDKAELYARDAELVRRTLAGDLDAFDVIVREQRDTVYRVAMRFVKNDSEADDVVQDTFMNAFRKLDSFKGDAALGSWLYRIGVNTSLMRLRKKKRRSEVSMEAMTVAGELPMATFDDARSARPLRGDEAVEKNELREKIMEAVEELEPKYQNVFVLKEFEGLSLEEIGESMSLSVPAVKSRLHRARLHMRATLERYVEGTL
ncbi:MAG: sigma-70 family RNA polymerase sigma factor [bacterium]